MKFRTAVSNAVTLGGHQKIQAASADYAELHGRYLLEFERERTHRAQLDAAVAALGSLTSEAFKCLECGNALMSLRSKQLRARKGVYGNETTRNPTARNFERVDKLVVRYSEALTAAGGLGAGSAAAIGSWSIVSLLGTASTGTAISTLSGAAATHATLAWFGGGALAAGGAGMAGGTLLLGGVVFAPVVGILSWHSRAKAEKIIAETNRIKVELHNLVQLIEQHQANIVLANRASDKISKPANTLMSVYELCNKTFFPVRMLSYGFRKLRTWCGGEFFRPEDVNLLNDLELAIAEFECAWDGACPAS